MTLSSTASHFFLDSMFVHLDSDRSQQASFSFALGVAQMRARFASRGMNLRKRSEVALRGVKQHFGSRAAVNAPG
jgi:hypothetical protein